MVSAGSSPGAPSGAAHPGRDPDRPSAFLVSVLLMTAVLVAFGQVLEHDFVNYDDDIYVTENRHVQQGLTRQEMAWAFWSFHAGNWHPLTWLSHMLDVEIYGPTPRGHHATNLALHVANAMLLLQFFWRTTGRLGPSVFVAALFALHPLRVESVAWVAERKDVLCGFFWMLSLCAYGHYAARPSLRRYSLLFVCCTAGILAKPMFVTMPGVLLLLDYWPLDRLRRKDHDPTQKPAGGRYLSSMPRYPLVRLVWEKIPLVLLALASSVITLLAQRSARYVQPFDVFPMDVRLANTPVAYAGYLGKFLWPQNLAVPYPHPGDNVPVALAVVAAVALVAVTVWSIRSRRTHPYFMVGWLWFLGTLVPAIGLVQVGPQAMADRYTYIPLIGVSVIVAWALPALWPGRNQGRALAFAGAVIVIALIPLSRHQARYWKNSSTLWERALAVTEDNHVAYANLGRVYLAEGQLEAAGEHLTMALAIRHHPKIQNNLGVVRYRQGRFQEALAHHVQALESQPDLAEAHGNIGNILVSQGNVEEGIRHWQEVLQLEPDNVRVRYNLGVLRSRQGRIDEAIEYFRDALEIQPTFTEAQVQLDRAIQRR